MKIIDANGFLVFKRRNAPPITYFEYRIYYEREFLCVLGENSIGHIWFIHSSALVSRSKLIQRFLIWMVKKPHYYQLGR